VDRARGHRPGEELDEAELLTEAEFNAYIEELRIRAAAKRGAAPDGKGES